jgi:rhodanese-related sulfurtransferase
MIRKLAKRLLKRLGGENDQAASPPRPVQERPQAPSPVPQTDLSNIECGAQELRERVEAGEEVVIVDVREQHELDATGVIEGALHIPLREISVRWEELKEANEIVCYCAMGGRSYNAAMLLRKNGLFNATSMDGGMTQWRAIGAKTVPAAKG